MEKRDRLRFSPWLTLKAFIKYYLMVGNGRSAEAKKSSSPIMCWIYAWQILSHNMSLIYACPQVWAIIVKEGGEIWPDGGRRDSRMRTVEVLLRWRGGLTFSGAKTARFVNSSRRPTHPLREDNYFTPVRSWAWYTFTRFNREKEEKKKRTGKGVAMDFWFTWQQDRIPLCISLGVELLTSGLKSIRMNKVFWVNWSWEANSRGRRDADVMCCRLAPGWKRI